MHLKCHPLQSLKNTVEFSIDDMQSQHSSKIIHPRLGQYNTKRAIILFSNQIYYPFGHNKTENNIKLDQAEKNMEMLCKTNSQFKKVDNGLMATKDQDLNIPKVIIRKHCGTDEYIIAIEGEGVDKPLGTVNGGQAVSKENLVNSYSEPQNANCLWILHMKECMI